MVVALIVPLLVAFLLCLHLYTIKVERSVVKREADFNNIAAQLHHQMNAAAGLLDTMFNLYEQPLLYHFNRTWLDDINQLESYYYRKIPDGVGEIVGQGRFASSPEAIANWQKVIALGPSFSTTLSLVQALSAVVYVNQGGFAYVKRRDEGQSELLTSILDGQFIPPTQPVGLSSTQVVNIGKQQYFAIGRKAHRNSQEYIVLIYDLAAISGWLEKVAPSEGEFIFINQQQQVIASSTAELTQKKALVSYWPSAEFLANSDNIMDKQKNIYIYKPDRQIPINVAFYQSHENLVTQSRYEVALEFIFLVTFLGMLFTAVYWLSKRIVIQPMTHFMSYLEQNDKQFNSDLNYQVPLGWQPWFARVKRVFYNNQQLVQSLQQANTELDLQVQAKSRELMRSYEAKDRHLALLNTMLNSVPDLIYFKNIDGSFLGCNKAYEQYIGVEQSQLVGQQLCDISDDNGEINALEQQVLKTHQKAEQRLNSNNKVYQLTIAPFYNEHRRLLGTMGIGRDISEQQQALIALKASESKFRSAVEYAANGVILLSLKHTVLQLNKTARKLFSVPKERSNVALTELFNCEQYQQLTPVLEQLLTQKQKVCHLTLASAEQQRWLQLSVSLVWDSEQEPYYYVIHIQDISNITKAKFDAERATLAKSRFIANLSHEIRTPLNAVTGLIDMLAQQGINAKQTHYANQAKQAAQSLLEMLNRMLDFARVESNQSGLSLSEFELVEFIDRCQSLIAPLCEQKQLTFNIVVDPYIANYLIADAIRLLQVLSNLLSNAVKFTEHGVVTLKIEKHASSQDYQQLCFRVIDTGAGIKEADQNRLFDAFTQGDESLTRMHQGVGLGLAIVKHEVELMGGEIALTSEEGKGSEFYFSLNFAIAKSQQQPLHHYHVLSQSSWLINALPQLNNTPLNENQNNINDECVQLITTSQELLDWMRQGHSVVEKLNPQQTLWVVNENNQQLDYDFKDKNVRYINSVALAQRLLNKKLTAADSVSEVAEVTHSVAGLLVLAVDDNQLNRDIISSILRQANITVVAVDNALTAIELVDDLQPDLILMDVQMPVLDGCQATKRLRKHYTKQQLPVFALTAHCETEDVARSMSAGMNKHLTKPVVAATLLSEIGQLNLISDVFFDRSFALSQFVDNEELLDKMLQKFADLCDSHINQLSAELSTSELEQLVHNIKGVSGNLGFIRLSQVAQSVEVKIVTASTTQISLFITELMHHLKQVRSYIQYKGS